MTMGHIQKASLSDLLAPILGMSKAEWLKNIANGYCDEEVVIKRIPKMVGSEKTFKPTASFEFLLNQVHLVCIDCVFKASEVMQESGHYPTTIIIQQSNSLSYQPSELPPEHWRLTLPMFTYEDFKEDPNKFVDFIKNVF